MGKFNIQTWHIIVLGLLFCVFMGYITIPGLFPPEEGGWTCDVCGQTFDSYQEYADHYGQVHGGTPPVGTDLVIVSKPLKFVAKHLYGGAAATGTGGYLYESDGVTLIEGGTTKFSSGAWTTSDGVASGTQCVLKYVYDTTNDDVFWYEFTVPKMAKADAESLTVNTISVEIFGLPTLTDSVKSSTSTTAIADAGDWNKTSGGNPGTDIATCTYEWYVAADNTGYLASKDPQYNMDLEAVIWVKLFSTNYENVIITGFDGAYEKGSAMYYYHVIDPTELAKYKVGQNYVYDGAGDFTWTVDLTGYTGDAADMQIYLEVYSDPEYHKTYGSFGPYAVELAEQTVNLVD